MSGGSSKSASSGSVAQRVWVVSLACTKPTDNGLAAELWRIAGLARFVATDADDADFPRLAQAGKSTVWRILDEVDIKPHRIRYYLERRDPDFDRKMHEVLMVYRDVSSRAEGAGSEDWPDPVYTVSVDEKPGVQALGLTAPDRPPVPEEVSAVGRDYDPDGWEDRERGLREFAGSAAVDRGWGVTSAPESPRCPTAATTGASSRPRGDSPERRTANRH